ncbi:LLM class flavin-dependent oxidoreductase [Microbacterium sp. ET2]|uniref:LLM class flavin-dependent oxidoreductase n=1 Tax=Microbacterium albipurpureum TaxID=3050384 RepID=UPI00259D1F78|nr:LLM class flavin-dependent oxidoreductase [Microbacterium sp. ET2 (Ac-2212)]WJL96943.1 LLM class flavin-dependent oxidoreductase [Microbacterium sp. ET2 (Ac-2212)]
MEFWLHGFPTVGFTRDWAVRAEAAGFTGVLLADSETLVADPYVELAVASVATERIGLGVAVTNPVTRHPAVTAAAIASVHLESGGRGVLGFARGDSALRQLNLKPATMPVFRQALIDLQRYLGDTQPAITADASGAQPLSWLPAGVPKVPVDVAATGPEAIAVGAVHGDRLTFNLGADLDRLRWAITHARDARTQAGLDPAAISLGAYVDVACAPTEDAITQVRGSASIFANFLAEGMRAGVPVSPEDAAVLSLVGASYSEAQHGQTTAPQAQLLPDDFLQRFALCGPSDALIDRVRALQHLGLDRLVVVPASRNVDPHATAASVAAFARDVIPAIQPRSKK